MYVKLENNVIKYAPKNYTDENGYTILNFNSDIELLTQYGYKELVQSEKPTTDRRYEITYTETEDSINEVITYIETEKEYNSRKIHELKEQKTFDNSVAAKEFRYNQTFTVEVQGQECVFDTSDETQRDLNTATNYCLATGGTYDGWTTNNGVVLNLTIEDINTIFAAFKPQADVYAKWLEFDTAIKEAETVEDLEAIEINYDSDGEDS